MSKKRRTTLIKPDGTTLVMDWPTKSLPDQWWLKRAVEGDISIIPDAKNGYYAYANDTGMLDKLPANIPASEILGYQHLGLLGRVLPYFGNIVILEGFPINGSSLNQLNPQSLGEVIQNETR